MLVVVSDCDAGDDSLPGNVPDGSGHDGHGHERLSGRESLS